MSISIKVESCGKCPHKGFIRPAYLSNKEKVYVCNESGQSIVDTKKINENCPFHEGFILGQEVICPDGHGRIVAIIDDLCNSQRIKVDTYANNRSCEWDSHNVRSL